MVVEEVSKEILSDDLQFVENFKAKGGKFLYTEDTEEINRYLLQIFQENYWTKTQCFHPLLINILEKLQIDIVKTADVFVTTCEFLLTEDGSILFSSNQLNEERLTTYPKNFVVLAYTSQLIQNKDKALSAIKFKYAKNIPTNISAIKDYSLQKKDAHFMNYGNNNSKNLYLLLLEDL